MTQADIQQCRVNLKLLCEFVLNIKEKYNILYYKAGEEHQQIISENENQQLAQLFETLQTDEDTDIAVLLIQISSL